MDMELKPKIDDCVLCFTFILFLVEKENTDKQVLTHPSSPSTFLSQQPTPPMVSVQPHSPFIILNNKFRHGLTHHQHDAHVDRLRSSLAV